MIYLWHKYLLWALEYSDQTKVVDIIVTVITLTVLIVGVWYLAAMPGGRR